MWGYRRQAKSFLPLSQFVVSGKRFGYHLQSIPKRRLGYPRQSMQSSWSFLWVARKALRTIVYLGEYAAACGNAAQRGNSPAEACLCAEIALRPLYFVFEVCSGWSLSIVSLNENSYRRSFQTFVLRLSGLQDGDVGAGVFPKRQEILIGGGVGPSLRSGFRQGTSRLRAGFITLSGSSPPT